MKRSAAAPLVIVFITLFLCGRLFAAEASYISDEAYALNDAEWKELETYADEISRRFSCGVYVVALESLNSRGALEYAETVYTAFGLGFGSNSSGVLLLTASAEGDAAVTARGDGESAFTEQKIDILLREKINPALSERDYYEAFALYLETAEEYLEDAESGGGSGGPEPKSPGLSVIIVIILTLFLITAAALRLRRRPSRSKTTEDK